MTFQVDVDASDELEVLEGDVLGFMAEGAVPIDATYYGREMLDRGRHTFSRTLPSPDISRLLRETFVFDTWAPCVFSFGASILPCKLSEYPRCCRVRKGRVASL